MRWVHTVIMATICLWIAAGLAYANAPIQTNEGSEAVIYGKYNLKFTCPPGWYFLQRQQEGRRLFDVVRLSDTERTNIIPNRRNLHDALDARAWLLLYTISEVGGSALVFAQRATNEIIDQGYELITSRASRESGRQVLTYTFRYRMPEDYDERPLWFSLRFFLADDYIFGFYGSCRSEEDLRLLTEVFSGIQFVDNR